MTPKEFRKHLRKEMTPAEKALWYELRAKRFKTIKFRRQHTIDKYTVDFYAHQLKLIIELDGEIHNDISQEHHDQQRDKTLTKLGYNIIRFQNHEIFDYIETVLQSIENHIHSLHLPPTTINLPRTKVPP